MAFFSIAGGAAQVHEPVRGRAGDLGFVLNGTIAPFIEILLAGGEGVVCESAAVLGHDPGLAVRPWPGLDGGRWLVVNPAADGSSKLRLGSKQAGLAGGFDLSEYGGRLIVPAVNLVANGPGVTAGYYARFRPLGLSMVLLEGNGWVFLRSGGDVEDVRLDPGERMCVRAHHVAAMTAAVDFDMANQFCGLANGQIAGDGGFAMVTGPGHVWLQSVAVADRPAKPEHIMPAPPEINEMRPGSLAFLNGTGA